MGMCVMRLGRQVSFRWTGIIVAAIGLLVGCGRAPLPPAPSAAYDQITPAAFAEHVATLADPRWGGRGTGSRGNALAAEYVAEQFRQAGLHPGGRDGGWFQPFQGNDGTRAKNVIGSLPGAAGRDMPTIILSAHYDHLSSRIGEDGTVEILPGADDNASGVSVLLLTARALARTPGRRCHFLFIAFGAEEIGFLGSKHYVDQPAVPLRRTGVLINIDQVGHVRGRQLLMLGSLFNPPISRALGRVKGDDKGGLFILPVPGKGTIPWSDQAPFARAGLPTLFFHCGRTKVYHTPQDTADRVNHDGGARVARLIFEVARAMDHEFAKQATSN